MKSNDDVRTNMKDQNYAAMSKHGHVDGIYPFPAVMQTRTIVPGTRSGLMKRSASIMLRSMRYPAQCERTLPSSWRSAGMRCVADNVEDMIIPDCGQWITEQQPAATTELVVDFLPSPFVS
jgi:hypothetical protein